MSVERHDVPDRGGLVAGIALIVLGAAFFAGQAMDVDVGHYGWPLFIIVPGVVILVAAMLVAGQAGVAFAVVGAITTVTGLVLLYGDTTDHWESWAYAWALVAPGAVGAGMLLHGLVHDDPDLVGDGSRILVVGVAIFLVLGLFLEDIVGIGGNAPPVLRDAILPAGLVFLGAAIVAAGIIGSRVRPEGRG